MAIINASHWQHTQHHTFTHYFSGSTFNPQFSFDDAMNPANWKQRYGAYAHVFIDHSNQELLMIRDHFGCEPLYYYRGPAGLIFGSTLPEILEQLPVKPEINQPILLGFFDRTQIYTHETIYQNVYRAEPGHIVHLKSDGTIHKIPFWTLDINAKDLIYRNDDDYLKHFSELLHESVQFNTLGVDNLGAELSGGLDSSAILATAHRQGLRYPLFMHIANPGSPEIDDRMLGDLVLHHLQLEDVVYVNADDFDPITVFQFCAEQFAGPAPYLFFTLAHNVHQAVVKRNCKVLLSGLGGDECVSGHAPYSVIPPSFPRRLKHLIRPPVKKFPYHSVREFEWHQLQGANAHELYIRVEYSAVLAKAMGFEYRYPLLYPPLVEFCFYLPPSQKRKQGMGRYLMRRYLSGLVPPAVYTKKQKIGGIVPATMDKCNRYLAEGKFDLYFQNLPWIDHVKISTPRSKFKNPMTAYMLHYYLDK